MRKLLAIALAGVLAVSAAPMAMAEDGVFTGTANGIGAITVNLTVAGGKITAATVDTSGETPNIGLELGEQFAAQILDKGAIDAVAGATVTVSAAQAALAQAMTAAGLTEAAAPVSYVPGTYTGKAQGRIADIAVTVTVNENAIESVTIGENSETPALANAAFDAIPAAIVKSQSLGVDTVAGATLSSIGVINAVADAVAQACADAAALRAVPVEAEAPAPVSDITTDVVVVGGGLSGMVAAITAKQLGADVVLVEKLPFIGGTLSVSAGSGMVWGTKHAPAEVVDPSSWAPVDASIKSTNQNSGRQVDEAFAKSIIAHAGRALDFLMDDVGLPYEITAYANGSMMAAMGTGSDGALKLANMVNEKGVTLLLNSTATSIVMEDGAAKGVKVSAAGGEFTVHADKVIMAAGGASYDYERTLKADPELARVPISRGAIVGATGDGFRMLEEIGAEIAEPIVKPGIPDFAPEYHFITYTQSPYSTFKTCIMFDEDGERFYDENKGAVVTSLNLLHHGSPVNYVLYDANTLPEVLTSLLDRDDPSIIVKADTIEELASKLSIAPRTLRATFDAYQKSCELGEDNQFGKDPSMLVAYAEEGPYYAAVVIPATFGTLGGAITDEQMRVLNAETGEVIPNVFAVGENATSRLFSDSYMGGYSHGYYRTMGFLAAETAVAELNAK